MTTRTDSSSDGDIDNLDEEYDNTVKTINTFENPEEINFDKHIDKETMNQFYEKLKKMPRDQVTQLLANLGTGTQMGMHDFSEVTETNRSSILERFNNKKTQLKMKRMSAHAIKEMKNKYDAKKDHVDDAPKDHVDDVPKDHVDDASKDHVDDACTVNSNKLSKSKKRRERIKAKKHKTVLRCGDRGDDHCNTSGPVSS